MSKKVLVVATSRRTRGGITAVIKAHENGQQWKDFHCHWVQTHRDGPTWRKLAYLLGGMLDFVVRLPFYDIVHFHISMSTTVRRKLPFMKLAKLLGKKTIVHLHCSNLDEIWNESYDYIFGHCDVALVLANNIAKDLSSRVSVKRLETIYNPCPELLQDHVDYPKKKEILFSGTVIPAKGYQDLIKAFAQIATKYPEWRVVFAGNGEIEQGKKLAEKLGIANQIVFSGWIGGEEKERAFGEASIFCLPSYNEGFPMAVLDAWAYGLPVITTPVGGIPDVAIDGENLLLFNPGDIESLARCLDLMISDVSLRDKISAASRQFASDPFSLSAINSRLSQIYAELI